MLSAYGESVIDVGAGTGLMLPAYLAHFRQVWALEPSPEMLNVLKGSKDNERAIVLENYAENIPLPDGHVDIAIAKSALHHFADSDRGLAEMKRVSRRAVGLIEVIAPDQIALEFARRIVAEKESHRSQHAFYTEQMLREMLNPLGDECHVLHFDQYIEVDPWLKHSDLSDSDQQRIRMLITSQPQEVRRAMQIHERHGLLVMLRRMCLSLVFASSGNAGGSISRRKHLS